MYFSDFFYNELENMPKKNSKFKIFSEDNSWDSESIFEKIY